MPRVKRGTKRLARRKKILKRASGYFLTKSKLYQAAQEAVERGLKFAYTGRRQKKRQFRSLWIVRINAAAKQNGVSYSQLIHGLKVAGIELDRKILADLATNDAAAFAALAKTAKDAAAKQRSFGIFAVFGLDIHVLLACGKRDRGEQQERRGRSHRATNSTEDAPSPLRKPDVSSSSNLASSAPTQRKKRSLLARWNCAAENSG